MVETRWEIEAAGRSWDRIANDRRRLVDGVVGLDVVRPCVIGDGIGALAERHEAFGRAAVARTDAFIPASGAATRLFASWSDAVLRRDLGHAEALDDAATLPFWPVGEAPSIEAVARVLDRWGGAPKGLLPVHAKGARPVDEHLAESELMGLRRVHFTVSPEHRAAFEGVVEGRATLSVQDPSTDTLAFTDALKPWRDEHGDLVFRPGGHGALLGNLDAFGRDFVLIKNIDNVVSESHRAEVVRWRLRLLGMLSEVHGELLSVLARGSSLAAQIMLKSRFGVDVPERDALHRLDRPLRVCGMVRDQGEPGGGPYWVRDRQGLVSPQIVEGAQLLMNDPVHREARLAATHFNPVEIAAALSGPAGRWPLAPYVDHDAVWVVRREQQGRALVALEGPGLWNGAMSGWNTVFVEVPAEIFQPIKTVADLRRPAHAVG